jgi:hypothetical protein
MLSILPERGEPTNYTVLRLADEDGRTVGFRLTRLAAFIVDRKVYDIDITLGYSWPCDCPDAQFQNRECKHVHALRASLTAAGISIPAPMRREPAPQVQPEAMPAPQAKSEAESYFCPECRRWNDSPFCDNCPI